jgi:hypothetical protein
MELLIMGFIIICRIKPPTGFLVGVIFVANLPTAYLHKLMIFCKSMPRKERVYAFEKEGIASWQRRRSRSTGRWQSRLVLSAASVSFRRRDSPW